jgi:predicted dehydrogenase
MNTVRLGIIGVGNMGGVHARNIGKLREVKLAAICDTDQSKADRVAAEVGCAAFYDASTLIGSGAVDAVLIATPHYSHTTIGIEAFAKGLHVLVEKPISVHKADCERLIAAHKRSKKLVFCAMFMQRTDPHYQKIRTLVKSGELGELRRMSWIITNWFRSDAYYASGGWRATWKGEGGGVLLNQCPHNLDLMQWMCGMPRRVTGYCSIGKWHDIEVEDEVTAYLEYPNGATGVFVTSTGEAPGTNRLEICGERGKVVLENDAIRFTRNEVEMSRFRRTTKESFAAPATWDVAIPVSGNGGQHNEIIQNFVDSIIHGAKLIAPAEEGINSVELANAMLFSSMTGTPVDLPLDGAAHERLLKRLIAGSKFRKKSATGVIADMGKSFNR